jgi:Protein of unknown function (DUF2948)
MSDAPLRLMAQDAEDLSVLSVHLQDAELKVSDIVYLPRERRFAFAVDRFDWERRTLESKNCRRRTAVHFDGVIKVASKGVPIEEKDKVLNLLALAFEPGEAPGGYVLLLIEGGASIKLDVECLEAALKDLGPTWDCTCCPSHPEAEAETEDA